jgi:hypothetical protein
LTVNGEEARNDPGSPLATGDLNLNIPCFNVANVNENGEAIPAEARVMASSIA